MDSDAMIYHSIDYLLEGQKFFSVNSSMVPDSFFQGVIGAEPRNPLIGKALEFFFKEDLSALDSDYHLLCKCIFRLYQEIPEKDGYKLLKEIPNFGGGQNFGGDAISDSGKILFKHFWNCKESIPRPLKSRNLIYCCVFYNKDYLRLLELLLKSMNLFSTRDSFDFLVITSPEFEPLVKEMDPHLITFTLDFTTIFQAACARLFIFEYPGIQVYDKLLYLDTDILIKADLAPIFDLPIEDLLHGIESGTIDSPSFGGQFFNFSLVDKNLSGLNSGTLLFFNSNKMKNLFKEIRDHVDSFTKEGNESPYCMDQPFINFHAIKSSLYNNTLLNPFVSLFEGSDMVDNYHTSSICHFSFPIGNFDHKFARMDNFFNNRLNENADIVFKQFHWGSGNIVYDKNEVLITTWARGYYKRLSKYIYEVTWSGIRHYAIFNESFDSFTSIRLNDSAIGYHNLNMVLKDTIPTPSLQLENRINGNRKLVYVCVFHNRGYMELFRYLLKSLRTFSGLDDMTDLLIFTSSDFENMVHDLSTEFNIPIMIKLFNFKTMHEAACARTHIFEYERINEYTKILYLDTDIIVQGNLMTLFDSLIEDKLYVKAEFDLYGAGHGGYFFDFTKYKKTQPSFNSGTLLFRNSPAIRSIFHDIQTHIKTLKQTSSILPNCMDQPFITYHFIRNNMCDIDLISKHIHLAGDPNTGCLPPPPQSSDCIVCHFIWPIGDSAHKLHRMKAHLNNLLTSKID